MRTPPSQTRLILLFLLLILSGDLGCSRGKSLQLESTTSPGPGFAPPDDTKPGFQCTVTPPNGTVQVYTDANGALPTGYLPSAVEIKIQGTLEGRAEPIKVIAGNWNPADVRHEGSRPDASSLGVVGIFRPLTLGNHPLSFEVVSAKDNSLHGSCSATLELSGSAVPKLAVIFKASSNVVFPGNSVLLNYVSANASSCRVFRDGVAIARDPAPFDDFPVGPFDNVGASPVNTVFSVLCMNSVGETVSQELTVTINPRPAISLGIKVGNAEVKAVTIRGGSFVDLIWSARFVQGCRILDQGNQVVADNLSVGPSFPSVRVENILANSVFTLICLDPNLVPISDSVSVNVLDPQLTLGITIGPSGATLLPAGPNQLPPGATEFKIQWSTDSNIAEGACVLKQRVGTTLTDLVPNTRTGSRKVFMGTIDPNAIAYQLVCNSPVGPVTKEIQVGFPACTGNYSFGEQNYERGRDMVKAFINASYPTPIANSADWTGATPDTRNKLCAMVGRVPDGTSKKSSNSSPADNRTMVWKTATLTWDFVNASYDDRIEELGCKCP